VHAQQRIDVLRKLYLLGAGDLAAQRDEEHLPSPEHRSRHEVPSEHRSAPTPPRGGIDPAAAADRAAAWNRTVSPSTSSMS
jgi:hypothetical protein